MKSESKNMYLIGIIVNTHGMNGDVKIKQISDFDERFTVGSTVYVINHHNKEVPLVIEKSRRHKHNLLLKFKDHNTIQAAEQLKGLEIKIKHEQLTELEADEYYYHEIIGCHVQTATGEIIGIVDSILSPGANDVWIVKNKLGKEYLIPYIAEVVKEIDVANKLITINVMEGLLE